MEVLQLKTLGQLLCAMVLNYVLILILVTNLVTLNSWDEVQIQLILSKM